MIAVAWFLLPFQGRSLSNQVVPRPTGNNGYEEYLQAADVLRHPEASIYANWVPGSKPQPKDPNFPDDQGPSPSTVALYRRLNALSPLDVRREEFQRFGRALSLIGRGNSKGVIDPHLNMGPDTTFPEYSGFRALSRFADRAAAVYAAEGKTDRSTELLLDQLVFADNMGRSVVIANLVGSAITATTISAFSDLSPRLSRSDGQRIARAVDQLLARPVSARAVIPAELVFVKAGMQRGFASDGKDLFGGDDESSARARRMAQSFDSMTRSERGALFERIVARLDAQAIAMDRILAGPEKDWASGIATLETDDESAVDLESGLIAMLAPTYGGYVRVVSTRRTQLRLLGLLGRLIEYRWDFGHYPDTIPVLDPLTGAPFLYQKRADGTIRIASKGTPQTGEIELKYKRPPADPEPGGKP